MRYIRGTPDSGKYNWTVSSGEHVAQINLGHDDVLVLTRGDVYALAEIIEVLIRADPGTAIR
jgi:hypothetical protein